jgi:hypothetical protein
MPVEVNERNSALEVETPAAVSATVVLSSARLRGAASGLGIISHSSRALSRRPVQVSNPSRQHGTQKD